MRAEWNHGAVSDADPDDGAKVPLALQLREQRWESVASQIEAVALRRFQQRGFVNVTVDEITAAVGISPRTFYRYFPTKEDLLQLQIDRRSRGLREALAARPADEPPIASVRAAVGAVFGAEDGDLLRCWTDVIATTPELLRSVIGGIQLKSQAVFADFFADRLGLAVDALATTMLAATVLGVIQAAQIHWYIHGGNLASTVSEGLKIVEHGFGEDLATWARDGHIPDWPRGD
jgi:AcrR family transcriptional regulator